MKLPLLLVAGLDRNWWWVWGGIRSKLAIVRTLVEAGKVRTTYSAELGAAQMGLGVHDMLAVVMALTPADFYKSMTTHADHTILAGRVPRQHAGGRRVSEVDGHR
jgi:hypothetical protein